MACVCIPSWGQKLISYESGKGSRDPNDADIWILYDGVRAEHEGMILFADSALLDINNNNFTAYDNVKIQLSDATFIYGENLFYDAETRIVDIYGDTVTFIDGPTVLKTAHLAFDRNDSVASYDTWGHTTNDDQTLKSREGYYYSGTKIMEIFRKVELSDSSMILYTDTLYYNTDTKLATFVSPTNIYSDSTHIYSENGTYNTETRYAVSNEASHIQSGARVLTCDSLHYDGIAQHGDAYGHVVIVDTVNQITCTGTIGATDQQQGYSFVTDSALVYMVDENGDSLFMHADTVYAYNDTNNQFTSIQSYYHAKVFRFDLQGMCDSAYYSVGDSLLTLFGSPVLWYENYQCLADTIVMRHDSTGIARVWMHHNLFIAEWVDSTKFNQLKGRNGVLYFTDGEPTYGDVLGNAQLVYYITEEDSVGNLELMGVNAGVSSDMRIYFHQRKLHRLLSYVNPDMHTYPVEQLPDELKRLNGFRWYHNRRPHSRYDVFSW